MKRCTTFRLEGAQLLEGVTLEGRAGKGQGAGWERGREGGNSEGKKVDDKAVVRSWESQRGRTGDWGIVGVVSIPAGMALVGRQELGREAAARALGGWEG
jgi:hypothetical protein